jgi:hypothetical protein
MSRDIVNRCLGTLCLTSVPSFPAAEVCCSPVVASRAPSAPLARSLRGPGPGHRLARWGSDRGTGRAGQG